MLKQRNQQSDHPNLPSVMSPGDGSPDEPRKNLAKSIITHFYGNKLKMVLFVVFVICTTIHLHIEKIEKEFGVTAAGPNSSLADNDNYRLAKIQSLGFFDDVRNDEWELLQKIVAVHEDHKYPDQPLTHNPIFDKRKSQYLNSWPAWWETNYEPNFSCRFERRIGGGNGNGDGTKWICDPHRIAKLAKERKEKDPNHPGCVVYSIGSNDDFSFEWGMEQEVGPGVCEFHIFDMGNYTETMETYNFKRAHYHQWGLGRQDPKVDKPEPGQKFYGLRDTIKMLGHEHLDTIDVFKIDCEQCEWETFGDWFAPEIPSLQQIQVELHTAPKEAIPFFTTMEEEGYVRFHKESNMQFSHCIEYAFLKLDKEFFSLRKEMKAKKQDEKAADDKKE